MARPKGAKSDPIGTIFVRVEKDIAYILKRVKALRAANRRMKYEVRLNKRLGL